MIGQACYLSFLLSDYFGNPTKNKLTKEFSLGNPQPQKFLLQKSLSEGISALLMDLTFQQICRSILTKVQFLIQITGLEYLQELLLSMYNRAIVQLYKDGHNFY